MLPCVAQRGSRSAGLGLRRPRRARAAADRAMRRLREAVAAGFRDLAHMRTDTDLDPLRVTARFPAPDDGPGHAGRTVLERHGYRPLIAPHRVPARYRPVRIRQPRRGAGSTRCGVRRGAGSARVCTWKAWFFSGCGNSHRATGELQPVAMGARVAVPKPRRLRDMGGPSGSCSP